MKYQSKIAFFLVLVMTSAFAAAEPEMTLVEDSFVSYAKDGNLAQLRKIKADEIGLEVFFMALMESVGSKRTRTTLYLLSVHKFHSIELQSVLKKAASLGLQNEVEMFIDNGAHVDGMLAGETALMVAAKAGHDPVVRTLLKRGASVNLVSKTGQTAYDFALRHGRKSTAQIPGLRPKFVWKAEAQPSTLHTLLPYAVTAVAALGTFLYYRGVRAVQQNAVPREYHGRGLVLRLAPDPRSSAPAAPIAPVAAPADQSPSPGFALMRMVDRLPDPIRRMVNLQIQMAMILPEPLRAHAVAIVVHNIQRLSAEEASRIFALASEKVKAIFASAVAAAMVKALRAPFPRGAPAA